MYVCCIGLGVPDKRQCLGMAERVSPAAKRNADDRDCTIRISTRVGLYPLFSTV